VRWVRIDRDDAPLPLKNRMRAQAKFASRIKLIWPVQSPREKYFASVFPKSVISSHHPASTKEGRIAIVTNVEAGCGGRDDVVCA
jgi:hypothetical protein